VLTQLSPEKLDAIIDFCRVAFDFPSLCFRSPSVDHLHASELANISGGPAIKAA
jgi:hypothetical protein